MLSHRYFMHVWAMAITSCMAESSFFEASAVGPEQRSVAHLSGGSQLAIATGVVQSSLKLAVEGTWTRRASDALSLLSQRHSRCLQLSWRKVSWTLETEGE